MWIFTVRGGLWHFWWLLRVLKIAHLSASGIGYGSAMFGLLAGLCAWRLGRTRLAPLPRLLFPVYVSLLVCAPYPLGFWPMLSSHAMVYNRYGYALLGLLIVECSQRPRENAGGREECRAASQQEPLWHSPCF